MMDARTYYVTDLFFWIANGDGILNTCEYFRLDLSATY